MDFFQEPAYPNSTTNIFHNLSFSCQLCFVLIDGVQLRAKNGLCCDFLGVLGIAGRILDDETNDADAWGMIWDDLYYDIN